LLSDFNISSREELLRFLRFKRDLLPIQGRSQLPPLPGDGKMQNHQYVFKHNEMDAIREWLNAPLERSVAEQISRVLDALEAAEAAETPTLKIVK
jgi:hypothetical protein